MTKASSLDEAIDIGTRTVAWTLEAANCL